MSKPIVFLVPGFFGFTSVGAVSYFDDVERSLGAALRRRGVPTQLLGAAALLAQPATRRLVSS